MTAVAVMVLEIEAMVKSVSPVIGRGSSRLVTPKPRTCRRWSCQQPQADAGHVVLGHLGADDRRDRLDAVDSSGPDWLDTRAPAAATAAPDRDRNARRFMRAEVYFLLSCPTMEPS